MEKDINADKVGIWEQSLAEKVLGFVDVLDFDKCVRPILPRWSVDGLDLDWDREAALIGSKQVEQRDVTSKRCGNITHSPQLGGDQMLADLPRKLTRMSGFNRGFLTELPGVAS